MVKLLFRKSDLKDKKLGRSRLEYTKTKPLLFTQALNNKNIINKSIKILDSIWYYEYI